LFESRARKYVGVVMDALCVPTVSLNGVAEQADAEVMFAPFG
jgi:hypothetical protein